MKSDYMKRQTYMMSNLGLFYLILIALFAIPLLGTFVVIIIKGVLSFQHVILGGGIIVTALLIFYLVKFCIRLFRKIRQDGFVAVREARERAGEGEPVQIAFFNGLMTFSYGGQHPPAALPHPPLLPDMTAETASPAADPIRQIRELSELKAQGVIDAEEFKALKAKLIRDVCESGHEETSPSR